MIIQIECLKVPIYIYDVTMVRYMYKKYGYTFIFSLSAKFVEESRTNFLAHFLALIIETKLHYTMKKWD